jgi:hypothetical protein
VSDAVREQVSEFSFDVLAHRVVVNTRAGMMSVRANSYS